MAFDLSTAKPVDEQEQAPGFDMSTAKPVNVDDTEFEPMTALKNVPGSALQLGKDMATAVLNPIDTASAIWNVAKGFGDKAGLDLNGKNEEIYADAVMKMVNDRYGSMGKFWNTVNTDPVGAMTDIASVVSGGSAAAAKLTAKMPAIAKTARNFSRLAASFDPLVLTKNAGKAAVRTATKADLPTKWYEEVVKFSNAKLTPAERAKLYKTALDNKVQPTPKGVDKLNSTIEMLDSRIDEIIESADRANTAIPARTVLRNLRELKGEKGGFKLDAKSDLAAIDDVVNQFEGVLDDMGRDYVTVGEMQKFKQDLYDKTSWNKKRSQGTKIGEDINKNLGRGAREAIEEVDPNIAGLNRQLGDLLDLKPNIERAAGRIGNRNALGIQTPLVAAGAGAAGGQEAALVSGMLSFIFNPQNKAKLAIGLHHLKTGNPKWLDTNLTPVQARYATILAGRTNEELAEMGLLEPENYVEK